VVEGVVDGTFLGPALMFFEIGLELSFGFIGVDDKFPPGSEGQFTNIAVRSVRSAPDEPDDSEPAVGHGDMMAARCCGVKSGLDELVGGNFRLCGGWLSLRFRNDYS
jgi:hypothetical protein